MKATQATLLCSLVLGVSLLPPSVFAVPRQSTESGISHLFEIAHTCFRENYRCPASRYHVFADFYEKESEIFSLRVQSFAQQAATLREQINGLISALPSLSQLIQRAVQLNNGILQTFPTLEQLNEAMNQAQQQPNFQQIKNRLQSIKPQFLQLEQRVEQINNEYENLIEEKNRLNSVYTNLENLRFARVYERLKALKYIFDKDYSSLSFLRNGFQSSVTVYSGLAASEKSLVMNKVNGTTGFARINNEYGFVQAINNDFERMESTYEELRRLIQQIATPFASAEGTYVRFSREFDQLKSKWETLKTAYQVL